MTPPADGPMRLPATEVASRVRAGELRATEVAEAALARIAEVDPSIHAYLDVPDDAVARAEEIDAAVRAGDDPGPLAGVTVAVKDNICCRGRPTTAGSRILEGFEPPYDATVVTRLREAGALVLGKTNMDEFAMGSSSEHSAYGPVRNPWDTDRVPGGSSGGSAAAVAARACHVALGSDTGGSIRQPASLCGVVGLKPTYGRVSRYGLVAFASSLDQIGPLATNVDDAALLLEAIAGPDPRDATSVDRPADEVRPAPELRGGDLSGLRVGVPAEYLEATMTDGVREHVEEAIDGLVELGAERVSVSLPHMPYAIPTYYLVATAEASSNLARYDGVHYGRRVEGTEHVHDLYARSRDEYLGDEVKRRILLGTFVLSSGYYDAYYLKASKVRQRIREDFEEAFGEVDLVCGPTTPAPAFRLGEKVDDPLMMYAEDIFTVSVNLAGIPGLSVPCGRTGEGLPVGLQLLGPPWDEGRLLGVAAAWEAARPGAFATPGTA